MQHFKYIIILLFSLNNLIYSQNKDLNALNQYTYEELEDQFYNYKDNNQIENSKIVAKYYIQKARKEQKDKKYLAEAYVLNQYNQDLPTAIQYIDSLSVISKGLKDDRYPARIYLLKGMLYNQYDKPKLALDNFINALKYAKEKNNGRQIAIADLQIAYLNGYIGKHQETVKVLQYYYANREFLTEQDIDHLQLSLADAYIDINKYNEALKLIHKGLDKASKENAKIRYNRYLYLLGRYDYKTKQYSDAISRLEKCKSFFLENKLDFDSNYTMLYLGMSYAETKNKDNAVENFIKIDSSIQKTNNTFPEIRDIYTYLIDYFKEKKDKENQLYYIDRFLSIDETLDSQFKYISRELPRKYDTPKLLSEKEAIIRELNYRKHSYYIIVGLLFVMLITLSYLFAKSKRKEKEYRHTAQELIKSVNKNEHPIINNIETKTVPEKQIFDSEKNKLSEEITNNILLGLKIFEEKQQYLKKGITLNSLAKKIKTNSTYLSQVVNTHKEKNFAIYLNDLRIDYALNKLVKDKKFRSYKLSVIAEELGYNNEQAFALAFKKRTGTTLSIYLKEIDHPSSQSQKNLL